MISGSTHPSSTSVDSTTALANEYRPPQKDYAAAFAALQNTYGTPGMGPSLPAQASGVNAHTVSKTSSQNRKAPGPVPGTTATSEIQPGDTEAAARGSSTAQTGAQAMGRRILKAITSAFKKVIGKAGEGFSRVVPSSA